jgi:hypothetical protein
MSLATDDNEMRELSERLDSGDRYHFAWPVISKAKRRTTPKLAAGLPTVSCWLRTSSALGKVNGSTTV